MKDIFIFLIALPLGLCSCKNNNQQRTITEQPVLSEKNVATKEIKVDPRDSIHQIIFGTYCGECASHCATMYNFNRMGNQITFRADFTDSYFKERENMTFGTALNDTSNFRIGSEIIAQIPDSLLNSSQTKYGCPDCTDGCGIYFEMRKDNKKQKFLIDNQTEMLTGQIKEFAEFLQNTIREIKKKHGPYPD